tara:strand:- start:1059 stop:2393 length:1335 start_codon:yes stop_codon:yes gene_type:complete
MRGRPSISEQFGIQDIMSLRQQQSEQLGDAYRQKYYREEQERKRRAAERAAKRQKKQGLLGALLGGVAGVALGPLAGLTGVMGGLTGASMGAKAATGDTLGAAITGMEGYAQGQQMKQAQQQRQQQQKQQEFENRIKASKAYYETGQQYPGYEMGQQYPGTPGINPNAPLLGDTGRSALGVSDELPRVGEVEEEEVITTAPKRLLSPKAQQDLDKENRKEQRNIEMDIEKFKMKGWTKKEDMSKETLAGIPQHAIKTYYGTELVKPPRNLTGNQATILSNMQVARGTALDVIKGIDSDKFSSTNLRESAMTGWKGNVLRFAATDDNKKERLLRSNNLSIMEAVGRGLTGAAMPDTEVTRFMAILSWTPLDTPEIVKYKLERSRHLMNKIEQKMKYGSAPGVADDDFRSFYEERDEIEDELNQMQEQQAAEAEEITEDALQLGQF